MITLERPNAIYLGAQAFLVGDDRCETAWAEKHVKHQPDLKWVLGNFVEADRPNDNGHIFPIDDLKASYGTVVNKPLNMLHRRQHIVGHYVAAELMWPTDEQADAGGPNAHPYVEALAAFYRSVFPEEYKEVEVAHDLGMLYYSMETVPESVSCPNCEATAAYDGRASRTYCDHMNAPGGQKRLNKPHFTAGALIIPPVRPGWKRADINELSGLIEANLEEAELAYNQIASEFPHLGPKEWEAMMAELIADYMTIDEEKAKAGGLNFFQKMQLAKKGQAMKNGSLPIPDLAHLKAAIPLAKTPEERAHVIVNAKRLDAMNLIPEAWTKK
jgi:hypothetical protein